MDMKMHRYRGRPNPTWWAGWVGILFVLLAGGCTKSSLYDGDGRLAAGSYYRMIPEGMRDPTTRDLPTPTRHATLERPHVVHLSPTLSADRDTIHHTGVAGARIAEAAPEAGEAAMSLAERLEAPVTLNLREASISDVLRVIGQSHRLNILGVDGLEKKVTLSLHDVPLRVALDQILRRNGYTYMIEDGILIVQGEDRTRNVRVYRLNYAKVSAVEPILSGYLASSKSEGKIDVMESPSRLVVTAPTHMFPMLDSLVRELDRRPRQVMIQASIVSMNKDSLYNFGTRWGAPGMAPASGLDVSNMTGGTGNAPANQRNFYTDKRSDTRGNAATFRVDTPGMSPTLPGGQFVFGAQISKFALDMQIDALVREGKARVLSQPRIGVISEESARILIGEEALYNMETTATGSGNTVQQNQFREVGIRLEVTPIIGEDDYVTIQIKPEVSSFLSDPTVTDSPPIRTTKAETKVVVKNGHTAMIGGLLARTDSDGTQGVPGIRRVPILRFLAGGDAKTQTQQEIVVFITPMIVPTGEDWPEDARNLESPETLPWDTEPDTPRRRGTRSR